MKIIHLSDLHLGARLDKVNLHDDQEYILRAITDTVRNEKPEALIIAGDIYDKADPPADAVDLFDGFVTALTEAAPEMHIMIVSGNHDSADRVGLYRSILTRHNIHLAGPLPASEDEYLAKITLHDAHGPVNFYLLPFVRPGSARRALGDIEGQLSYADAVAGLIARERINTGERNVIATHQFYVPAGRSAADMDSERTESELPQVGNVDAVPASVLEPFTYAALGHLHRPMNVGSNARYSGTPLQYSKSEADQDKSITVVELDEAGSQARVSQIPLKPLRPVRKVRGTLEELTDMTEGKCRDLVYVTLEDDELPEPQEILARLRDKYEYMVRYDVLKTDAWVLPDAIPIPAIERKSVLDVCLDFLSEDISEDEVELLKDVIRSVQNETD